MTDELITIKLTMRQAVELLTGQTTASTVNPDSVTFDDIYRERAARLADELMRAFPWADTLDGTAYWLDVHGRLKRFAREGK